MSIEKQLINIVAHAYSKVPFYIDMKEEMKLELDQWNNIPVIEKEMLLTHASAFIEPQYLLFDKEMFYTQTSGSTGKCLDVYWNHHDYIKSLITLWVYRKKYYDINPQDKHCYFYVGRNLGQLDSVYEKQGSGLGFCKSGLDYTKLKDIYNMILEFQPKWMLLQPSLAVILSDVKRKYNLPAIKSLKYLELSGEMLFDLTRKKLKKEFQCAVVNQYGAHEVNSIAYECREGHLHCMETNVLVEVLDNYGNPVEEGMEGNIYVTSLMNYAMPFIRYNIGDRGILYDGGVCKCGNKEKILVLTSGRINDWILQENGEKINTYVFVRAVENVNRIMEGAIIQFQIIQKDFKDFIVKLVIEDDCNIIEIQELFMKNLWQPSLEGSSFHFEIYDILLPEDRNGKLYWFKNEMKANDQKLLT